LQHAGDWGAATQEHVAFLLSIADLVQRLRDARAKLKMTCAATADCLLMLRELDEVEAGPMRSTAEWLWPLSPFAAFSGIACRFGSSFPACATSWRTPRSLGRHGVYRNF